MSIIAIFSECWRYLVASGSSAAVWRAFLIFNPRGYFVTNGLLSNFVWKISYWKYYVATGSSAEIFYSVWDHKSIRFQFEFDVNATNVLLPIIFNIFGRNGLQNCNRSTHVFNFQSPARLWHYQISVQIWRKYD